MKKPRLKDYFEKDPQQFSDPTRRATAVIAQFLLDESGEFQALVYTQDLVRRLEDAGLKLEFK